MAGFRVIIVMSPAMISLKSFTPEMTAIFQEVRLRALRDSPQAFSSTYAKEALLSDEEWTARAQRWNGEDAILVLAFDDPGANVACGIVGCYTEDEDGTARGHVISMWVDGAYRRAGVGTLLIDELKKWARSRGLHQLKLMVTSVNGTAIDFYEQAGFRKSGKTAPYPNDPSIFEHEMLLCLRQEAS